MTRGDLGPPSRGDTVPGLWVQGSGAEVWGPAEAWPAGKRVGAQHTERATQGRSLAGGAPGAPASPLASTNHTIVCPANSPAAHRPTLGSTWCCQLSLDAPEEVGQWGHLFLDPASIEQFSHACPATQVLREGSRAHRSRVNSPSPWAWALGTWAPRAS